VYATETDHHAKEDSYRPNQHAKYTATDTACKTKNPPQKEPPKKNAATQKRSHATTSTAHASDVHHQATKEPPYKNAATNPHAHAHKANASTENAKLTEEDKDSNARKISSAKKQTPEKHSDNTPSSSITNHKPKHRSTYTKTTHALKVQNTKDAER
jgi:hypothetical protein